MDFRIYYGDGSTYEGDPFQAPGVDVQVVVVKWEGPRGWRKVQGKEVYLWMGPLGWRGADVGGMWDYFAWYREPQKVLMGRTIHDDTFNEISKRASAEGLG
jgi:hypothetical protein